VPRLVAALEGCDFVIGSRYVAGGSIPQEWPLVRRVNSRLGNLAARFIAGLHSVRDCTGGFRAIRAHLLEDLDSVESQGYCFQVDLLHRAIRSGARVREVPIAFAERAHGESKLGLSDQIEFALLVWRIRLRDSGTFLRFLVVGLLGVIVNLGAFLGLMELGVGKFLASPIAIEISILTNFLLNNYWTFAARDARTALPIRGLRFNLVSLLALGVSYTTFVLLSLLFPSLHPTIPQLLGILPATAVNYLLNSYWTWPRSASF
jgi:dolichol-phosphate mannosyltransferase